MPHLLAELSRRAAENLAPTASRIDLQPLVERLDRIAAILSDGDRAPIAALPAHRAVTAAGSDLAREGLEGKGCTVVLDGTACIYTLTADGRRQITALQTSGDPPINQIALADALGASPVHVNRLLRGQGLIARDGTRLTARDRERLAVLGASDPAHLQVDREPAET